MEHWWKNSTLNRNPVGGTANLTVPQVLASCTEASCSPARITQKSEDANQVLVEITWSRIRRLAAANSPTSALSTRNGRQRCSLAQILRQHVSKRGSSKGVHGVVSVKGVRDVLDVVCLFKRTVFEKGGGG